MPGPAPSRNARRSNRRSDFRFLPASGRQAPAPEMPFSDSTERERDTWGDLWSLPQAVAWEELHLERVVARYTRMLVASEGFQAKAALLSEVRQLEDRLGLTPMSLKRLQWDIETATDYGPSTHGQSSADLRRRLRVAGELDEYRDL